MTREVPGRKAICFKLLPIVKLGILPNILLIFIFNCLFAYRSLDFINFRFSHLNSIPNSELTCQQVARYDSSDNLSDAEQGFLSKKDQAASSFDDWTSYLKKQEGKRLPELSAVQGTQLRV